MPCRDCMFSCQTVCEADFEERLRMAPVGHAVAIPSCLQPEQWKLIAKRVGRHPDPQYVEGLVPAGGFSLDEVKRILDETRSGKVSTAPSSPGLIGKVADRVIVDEFAVPSSGDDANPKDVAGRSKPWMGLIPVASMEGLARVMELGAKKYGPYNWRAKPIKNMVYAHAALRHLFAWIGGQSVDPESGQSHLAHVASCMMIILDAEATGNCIEDRVWLREKGNCIEDRVWLREKGKPEKVS